MIDFNAEPYYDNFDEDNKFYRILFRPSYAVQARELTQLQTILQNQITRNGNHIFSQGAMVIPGQVSIDTNFHCIKLESSYGSFITETFIQNISGQKIIGSSGIKAQIIKVVSSTITDPTTLYIRYTSSGTDTTSNIFSAGEVITTEDSLYSFQVRNPDGIAVGCAAIVERGVYYVNGQYVLCADLITGKEQILILDKYSNTPSYRIGLSIIESVITPEDDETLLDNAQASYNFAAPGAHRYYIDLVLSKRTLNSEDDENFIELVRTDVGDIKRIVTKTEYNELEKTFARRTFDESGNYTVRPFNIDIREARTNDRGAWITSQAMLIGDIIVNGAYTYIAKNSASTAGVSGPTHTTGTAFDGPGSTGVNWEYTETPIYNRGMSRTGSNDQLAVVLDPGKAYIQGYEIEKVSAETVLVDKCRSADHIVQIDNGVLPQTVGNYVVVNFTHGAPPVNTFDTVDLYNHITQEAAVSLTGTLTIGTGATTVAGSGTAFLTELVIGSLIYNSSGVYSGTIATITNDTTATLVANGAVAIGGAAAKKDGRGTAVGTKVGTARVRAIEWHNGTIGTNAAQYKLMLFDIQMVSGYDFKQNVKSIYYNNALGAFKVDFSADIEPVAIRLVGSVTASSTTVAGTGTSFQTDLIAGDYIYLGTTIRRVASIASQISLTVDASITVTGVTLDRIITQIKEPNNETLLFGFPYYAIKSARGSDNTNQISYTVYERFAGTTSSAGSGHCTLQVSTGSGTMGSAAETDNYILIDNTTGLIVPIDPTAIAPSGNTVIFTLTTTPIDYSVRSFIVIGAVSKTLSTSTEKTKTLTSSSATFTTQAAATLSNLSLGIADGYRIISIKQATGFAFGTSPTTGQYTEDISDRYDFHDGQTTSYYGLSSVVLKSSFAPPNAPVLVTFEYFSHGSGDYFTVNSYTDIDYKNIPFYGNMSLRDSIDFRPRADTTGIAFTGAGASVSLVPKRGFDIQADFTYYLSRTDKIAIDFNGNFFAIQGVPSLVPGDPSDPTIGMVLYTINLEPYTFTTSSGSVRIKTIDNKRYTMRDIGKLEKRIDNIEYYTSLTLLEQETQALNIVDSATGLTRFKNGFIVDNFSGHSTGDVSSSDYFCSIDMENNELRPFYSMKNINLIEKNSNNTQRTSSNYKLFGDVITLPIIEHKELVKQQYGSRLENINPFAIFTFLGKVDMNPSSDDWFEVDRRPDVIQNQEGNFNTISMLAEKAGVLGTVWNAWQTQWTGTTITSGLQYFTGGGNWANARALSMGYAYADLNAMFGGAGGGGPARQVIAEFNATLVGQSRTGINTKVVAKIDTRQVDDRILSTAVIPYIRSRNVLIQTTGLKPNTKFYPFFDNVDVSEYCTPATKITFTEAVSFNTQTNVGGGATVAARRINGDTEVCLNRGDIITGGTSAATAIVIGSEKEYDISGNIIGRSIYVVNVVGTFTVSETIAGSISGVSATIATVGTTKVAGDPLVTNFNGEINLLFDIPNTESIRFRTGTREFTLTDSSSNSFDFASRGRGNYYANGVLETKQATFTATRNAEIVREVMSQNQTVVQTSTRVVSDTGWYDPLAQTFLVKQQGGAFLTKVDLFFSTKDQHIPVSIEIREVVNGVPGKRILPFSVVSKKPEDVNISSNMVDLPDGTSVPSYDTPTTFEFSSPVYVQDNSEYALVVVSDSNGYKVWISNMGDKIPNSSRTISEQPYAGVLFKSQNGSTWTENQDQDLKFTIYRAKFDTSVVGTVQFVNDITPIQTLDKDPFETNIGSAKVKVYQRNHGFAASSRVTIDNTDTIKFGTAASAGTITCNTGSTAVAGTLTVFETDIGTTTVGQGTVLYTAAGVYVGVVSTVVSQTSLTLVSNAAVTLGSATSIKIADPIDGIPVTEIYKQHTISAIVDNDSYVLTTTTTGKSKGYAGGTTVKAQQNVIYEGAQPIVGIQTFSETTSDFSMKTTSGKSVNGSESPYSIESTFTGVIANENNYFISPRLVASEENETILLSGNKSTTLQCSMSTTNDSLSPILDTHRMSLIAISNTVNSPTETNINQTGLDDIALLSANTTIAFTIETTAGAKNSVMSSANATARGLLATIKVGKYVTITGAANASNNGTFLVTAVATDGSAVTLYNAGYTSAAASATTIVVKNHFIDEISPLGSSSISKYVTRKINLENAATYLRIRMAVNSPSHSDIKVYYKTSPVGTKDSWSIINYALISSDATLPKVEVGDNTFTDVDFSLSGLKPYDAFALKIVFTSTNSAEVSRVKDLRIIACA